MENNEKRTLYKFEYYEPEDDQHYVDWVWLSDLELPNYKPEYSSTKIRKATRDEVDLYEEAYADGYGVAAFMEFESKYDGITFRVELNENGELDMNGKKMFECASCGNHKDFENEVAMSGDMFLGVLKDDKLWHLCFDCAMIGAEIGNIEIEDDEPR